MFLLASRGEAVTRPRMLTRVVADDGVGERPVVAERFPMLQDRVSAVAWDRIAAVATDHAETFEEIEATLVGLGYQQVIHIVPEALMRGPDVFWVLDLRVAGALDLLARLNRAGRGHGLCLGSQQALGATRAAVQARGRSMLLLAPAANPTRAQATRRIPALSGRQVACLQCRAGGLTNEQVAAELGISLGTVKGYLRGAQRRLGTTNTTHSVMVALRAGVLH